MTHILDPGFGPRDDLRHWPTQPGGRMRDSLFCASSTRETHWPREYLDHLVASRRR